MLENNQVTYESVTICFREEDRDPLTIGRVIELVESHFPGSGDRALQVIDDPSKRPSRGLLEATLILIRPKEIDHLVLRGEGETETKLVDEVIG